MADKKVNLIISLKDNVSSGLQNLRSGVDSLGYSFKALGAIAAGYLSFSALVSGIKDMVKAYAEQESANARLSATFTALGENGAKAIVTWRDFASAIQKVTTIDDEQVLGLVSLAKTMGIANSQIQDSVKGAIGLSKAFGLDLNSAMKMVALAGEDQYAMLSRYIPDLKSATTEAEKHAVVLKAMNVGFSIAKDEVKTFSGSMNSFGNAFRDAMEEVGKGVFDDGGFVSAVDAMKDKTRELTEDGSIKTWAFNTKEALRGFFVIPATGFSIASDGIKNFVNDVKNRFFELDGVIRKTWNFATQFAAIDLKVDIPERKPAGVSMGVPSRAGLAKSLGVPVEVRVTNVKDFGHALGGVKQTQGGFADLYKKMYASGESEYEKEQFTRFVASQEKAGVQYGVSGAGQYAANQRASGLSEYDVIQRVQDFIKAEVRGMAAGVQGVGAFAQQLIGTGASSYDVGQSVSGMIGNEKLGAGISRGLSDPLAKTNELLTQQNTILQERLGGVE